jgi:AcrR family transcriptional regulator
MHELRDTFSARSVDKEEGVGRPSTKERKPHNIDSIVDVAMRVFLKRGYDGASLDQVATAAGITKSSIYYHSTGKEDLLARGVGRAFDALFAALDEPEATQARYVDRLKYVVRRTIEVTVAKMPEVALLLRVRGNTRTERRVLERRREFDRRVAQLFEQAQRAGEIRSDVDARLATRLLFGMLNSMIEWYRPDGGLGTDDIARMVFRMAFEGLQ